MSSRYVRVPTSDGRHHELDDEVEAAFDYREDDDDDDRSISESQPLNHNSSHSAPPQPTHRSQASRTVPGTYNFETVDYDFPPPGSPPPPSAHALPNTWGNSNGLVPDFSNTSVAQPNRSWWKRTAANVLPSSVSNRLGLGRPSGLVGGGTNNDGVFANVTAKPTRPVRVQNDDGTYLVPEDAQNEAPPSYESAQADAVPPYWETTIHAPFSPESMGELIVDSLPTGSLFSFFWNMLVSISFQFIGFLLTYLLHTSHAARLGSRAGLGVTLIQYGFALRGKMDSSDSGDGGWDWMPQETAVPEPTASAVPSSPADAWMGSHHTFGLGDMNVTSPSDQAAVEQMLNDATTEWLSFFMMTMGWFILLTSVLGFYRVKRWERSIIANQQQREPPTATTAPSTAANVETAFALRGMSRIELLRSGLGLGTRDPSRHSDDDDETRRLNESDLPIEPSGSFVIDMDPNDPRYAEAVAAVERERSLFNSLRQANLI